MEQTGTGSFTGGGNDAVVRPPGRRPPGVLVRGDSLHTLRSSVAEVVEACERGDVDEARDFAGLVLASLDVLPAWYEAAWGEHGIPRPYRAVGSPVWTCRMVRAVWSA